MACQCITCAECGGSGQVMVATNDYPEEDLERCEHCQGSGISEVCDECQEMSEP